MAKPRQRPEGIQLRHRSRCASLRGGRCTCSPTFQAQVWSPRDRRPIRKTFATIAEAKAWRQDARRAVRHGTLQAPVPLTLAEAAAE